MYETIIAGLVIIIIVLLLQLYYHNLPPLYYIYLYDAIDNCIKHKANTLIWYNGITPGKIYLQKKGNFITVRVFSENQKSEYFEIEYVGKLQTTRYIDDYIRAKFEYKVIEYFYNERLEVENDTK